MLGLLAVVVVVVVVGYEAVVDCWVPNASDFASESAA